MTDAASVIAECRDLGITLEVADGRLLFKPKSAMYEGLLARIREHKPALIARLTEPVYPPTPWCQIGHPTGWQRFKNEPVRCAYCDPPKGDTDIAAWQNIDGDHWERPE